MGGTERKEALSERHRTDGADGKRHGRQRGGKDQKELGQGPGAKY